MSDELVKRLRVGSQTFGDIRTENGDLCTEAADAIERLTAELEKEKYRNHLHRMTIEDAGKTMDEIEAERDNAWNSAIEAAAGVIKSEEQRILARQDGKSPAVDTIIRTLAAKLPDVEIAIRALKKTE